MHQHSLDELSGPVRGSSAWWRGMGAQPEVSDEGTKSPHKRKKRPAREPGIRVELVNRVRAEIAAGTYDTQERWEAALDRLLDRLEGDA